MERLGMVHSPGDCFDHPRIPDDRSRLGDDFNVFLTDARVQAASARLGPLGAPTSVVVDERSERGGMEVATVSFSFAGAKLQANMFRSVDGRVQEFLIRKL